MSKTKQLLEGNKFNQLTVIKLDHTEKYIYPNGVVSNQEYYLCRCDCGKESVVLKSNLKKNHTKSCGCLSKKSASLRFTTHNLQNARLCHVFYSMRRTCLNKNYKNYCGRGIIICNEWKDNIVNFYNWAMANGYSDDLTIDRIDVNGNYDPSNCRWTTMKVQQRNRRNNRLITFNGETKCVTEWAKELRFNPPILFKRLTKGWSIERALTEKVKIYNKKVMI